MSENYLYETDVIVIGAGNAGMCAALSAKENGADVIVLEKAPKKERGGNSAFSAGTMRFAYNGIEDLLNAVPNLTKEEMANSDFGTYTTEQFLDDITRVTQSRTEMSLANILVRESLNAMVWLRSKKIRFVPIYGRQAFKVNGKFTFWGGLAIEVVGGGPKLIETLHKTAEEEGVKILYDAEATSILHNDDTICGVELKIKGKTVRIKSKAVVLASGGFQANTEMRTRYLGAGWELAKVRGTRYNTGEGIQMALAVGARSYGHWSGCHAVSWDYSAPEFGDLAIGDGFQKHSYPFGIMVNATGQRFVDEGEDFRNYTYAKYGRVILEQPGQFAWQIFDQKVVHLLRDEYRIKHVTKVKAKTIEKLAQKLDGVDSAEFLEYIKRYNEAVRLEVPFNPNIKDGRGTVGLEVPKTNWANTIDEGPFEAYKVTSGITFTYGGVRINEKSEVINTFEKPISGLFAAGELVGGLFYFNYPGGSGLTAGSVFGRIAGENAAKFAIARMEEVTV
ncbi:FAD-dependent tricarballylate dehydrogenase TcuA [Schinkia azotoformans]|uniref:Tricarballylate dehydrogenase n=1 Tax=Schinkia azotoformans LMG 9581 TaxID=1131731 RepID=K6DIF7_SCHAZ|nr:FAD-dependent tricarballylate dehydrogenase TcuA [Schinkia azotoformans]EKN67908.1 tricarballylate dehydrogenase [Schinkia azotoformans LMG 9581]MEC1637072.1 FAD-dependent tricarballylate dehydrogenase TcuA [Schinkia azotoformans]MEC1719902.1 FAD-dependent tricarballylate dehydrogenase TcuA [Schinkia azotoformans]MEC1945483.1 FAD-dependent tricarballylate dehydrogenase TcuA [Schinkia azotoformans]MED4412530.1 FAD-dependent tricarballylate dehydrogenase TcuA [Schinkia azotoformans]